MTVSMDRFFWLWMFPHAVCMSAIVLESLLSAIKIIRKKQCSSRLFTSLHERDWCQFNFGIWLVEEITEKMRESILSAPLFIWDLIKIGTGWHLVLFYSSGIWRYGGKTKNEFSSAQIPANVKEASNLKATQSLCAHIHLYPCNSSRKWNCRWHISNKKQRDKC